MMNEEEQPLEEKSIFIECPHCHVRVIPLANNICPSCREDTQKPPFSNLPQAALTLHESEELPPYCHSCNRYTDQLIRISADEESGLETIIFGEKSPENTTNVIVFIPECENCSESEIELVEVDYDHQIMKIMTHPGFRDRVLKSREG